MTNHFLTQELRILAEHRGETEVINSICVNLQAELEDTEIYKLLQVAREQLSEEGNYERQARGDIEEKALASYAEQTQENKEKNIVAGVSIAEYTTFEIDEDRAVIWASEHHHKALKLNLPEIKRVAKAGMEVEGVKMGKENKVRIATDLSEYLS